MAKEITKEALVSIIIPSKDNVQVLLRCLHTLLEKTQYPQYELVIVDNGSTEENRQWITSQINELQRRSTADSFVTCIAHSLLISQQYV